MTEITELEGWRNTAEIITEKEGSELVMTTSHDLSIPIDEIPANTLSRLSRMKIPTIPQVLIAGTGFAAIVDTAIFRMLPQSHPGTTYNGTPSEWIEFLAGLGLVVAASLMWVNRVDLANAGERELRNNLIIATDIATVKEDLTPTC